MTYEEKREALMKDIDVLIAQKKTSGANAKMLEVEELDAQQRELEELTAKAEAAKLVAVANAAALDEIKPIELKNITEPAEVKGVKESMNNEPKIYNRDDNEYRVAFLKKLQGASMTADEMTMLDSGASSAGHAIPTITQNKIIEKMTKLAPMIGEVELLQIPGFVKLPIEGTVNAAGLHTENANIIAAEDTVTYVSLGGYEIVKVLQISATVETMSVDAFEDWVVSNISRSMASALENYLINGTGDSQPKGVKYAEEWSDGTNARKWAAAALADGDLTAAISYLPARCDANAKFLMNKKTYWANIAKIRDDGKYKIVEQTGDGYAIHGYPVLFSDKMADGVIYLGDFREGVKANLARPIGIAKDASAGFISNSIIYRGECLFDCVPVTGNIIKIAAIV